MIRLLVLLVGGLSACEPASPYRIRDVADLEVAMAEISQASCEVCQSTGATEDCEAHAVDVVQGIRRQAAWCARLNRRNAQACVDYRFPSSLQCRGVAQLHACAAMFEGCVSSP